MAYMNQTKKAAIQALIKPILAKYGVKGSLSVCNHSTIVLTLKSGKIDFIENLNRVCGSSHYQTSNGFRPATRGHVDVNPYWYHDHFDGKARKFLDEALRVLNTGNHDNSDSQTDYFDVGWYVDVKVGKWNKPYIVESV
jgi:hypothetical protein